MDRESVVGTNGLADAEKEVIDVQVSKEGNHLVFQTDSFSPFVLVYESDNGEPAPTTYTLTYNSNGGTSYPVETHNQDTTVTLDKTPTRSGYTFTGWYADTKLTQHITTIIMDSDKTVYAGWTKNGGGGGGGGGTTTRYTLTYDSNGGTPYDPEQYTRNTVVELDKVPVREGYTFTGWYADEELTERIDEITMNRNKTVYAGWEKTGVPDWLNGDDHFAYVIGYQDGTVRPMNNIDRAEVAAIFFRLLKPEIRESNLTKINSFSDVDAGAWYNTAVSTMASLGIIQGRTGTTFDPNAPITRAEFAVICARFDTGLTNGDSNLTDIAGHWAEAEIERAVTLGWIQGYEDGTFRPDALITRAEAMTLINRVLNRLQENESDLLDSMNVWPDNQPGTWYYLAVQEATNSHDFERKANTHEHWTELTADPDWTKYEN